MRRIGNFILTFILGATLGIYLTLTLSQNSYSSWVRNVDITRSFELANQSRTEYKNGNPEKALETLAISRYFLDKKPDPNQPSLLFPFFQSTLKDIANNTNNESTIYLYDCVKSYLTSKVQKDNSTQNSSTNNCNILAERFLSDRAQ